MRKFLLLFFVFTSMLSQASSSLDNRSRAILESVKWKMALAEGNSLENKKHKSLINDNEELYYPVIIKLSNDSVIDDLEALGTVIMHQRENFLLACIPYSRLDSVSRLPLVNRMSLSSPMSTTLDCARNMTNVNLVQQGIELPQSYNGNGVIVGFSDIGFDPSHPNFTDGRLKRFVHYDELLAQRTEMATPQQFVQCVDIVEWHATHVAGILAGGYKGLPYWGVATSADIVATTSSLYDMAILAGAEDVLAYAKSVGKPAVINMSLGYYLGPHDGTSLFNQYLDLIGEEAIVCLSSGNEGRKRVYIPFDATSQNSELKTLYMTIPM